MTTLPPSPPSDISEPWFFQYFYFLTGQERTVEELGEYKQHIWDIHTARINHLRNIIQNKDPSPPRDFLALQMARIHVQRTTFNRIFGIFIQGVTRGEVSLDFNRGNTSHHFIALARRFYSMLQRGHGTLTEELAGVPNHALTRRLRECPNDVWVGYPMASVTRDSRIRHATIDYFIHDFENGGFVQRMEEWESDEREPSSEESDIILSPRRSQVDDDESEMMVSPPSWFQGMTTMGVSHPYPPLPPEERMD